MDEYIMRQAVLDAYEEEQRKNGPWRFETLIESVPAADVAPVVHGHWKKEVYVDPYGADWTRYHCSLCGRVEIKKEPYCNCGAKMDGGQHEAD